MSWVDGVDANYQHLKYVFEGYRAYVSQLAAEANCPYSPGSTRAESWNKGRLLAFSEAAVMDDGCGV